MTSVMDPFDAMVNGKLAQSFSGQYNLCLVRDYDPTQPLTSFTPFDTMTGNISSSFFNTSTGLFTGGWQSIGYGADVGVKFTPSYTLAPVIASQVPRELTNDISKMAETAEVTALQSNPLVLALQNNIPLASMPSLGAAGSSITQPRHPYPVFRQFLFFAFMMTPANLLWAKCKIYSSALALKPSAEEWSGKKRVERMITAVPTVDDVSGFDVRELDEGPGYRALGGTPATPGTPVATATGSGIVALAFTAPASGCAPFMYNAFRDGTAVPGTDVTVGGTAANPTLTLASQTTGAATYTVQAVGANLANSAQSAASNSVTVT